MIKYLKMDVTTANSGIIAHGVNCQGVMGSGVALAIKNKFPAVYQLYSDLCEDTRAFSDTKVLLGRVQHCKINDELYVANCFTQDFYGKDGKQYASYDADRICIGNLFQAARILELPIYMPKIGCGLGGLEWGKVQKILEENQNNQPNTNVFVCEI